MKLFKYSIIIAGCLIFCLQTAFATDTLKLRNVAAGDPPDNNTITIPAGFKATVFADSLGSARHLAVTPNGNVYVKLRAVKNGKGIIRLKDTNGDGIADERSGFSNYPGTGITIKNGYLYASSNKNIYRYKLDANGQVTDTTGEVIVSGLWDKGTHNSKSIALDNAGNLYVNIGAPSNVCQLQGAGLKVQDPCPLLDSSGGIWQFKADQLNQTYAQGKRYATGIRNVVGLDWNSTVNQLFVMQHGRDALHTNYPALYTDQQSAELPSEEMIMVRNGGNYGWPYCYYDKEQQKKILAPEYGGDSKMQGRCEMVDKPVAAFPGHWAPNGLLFYTGNMFPEKYKMGAFIAFHGSWNRAPEPQKGFFVAFVPFKDGKPNGDWEIFADGFSGKAAINSPGQALHRPCGLAQGPDGSLYVSDDVKGAIYRIIYRGK